MCQLEAQMAAAVPCLPSPASVVKASVGCIQGTTKSVYILCLSYRVGHGGTQGRERLRSSGEDIQRHTTGGGDKQIHEAKQTLWLYGVSASPPDVSLAVVLPDVLPPSKASCESWYALKFL